MSLLGHTFVGFADNIMVGQLGSADLAAVSLGNSFFFVAMSLGIGFSTAITPLVAEADSENNFFMGKSAFKHGLFLCSLLSLLLFGMILLVKPLMFFMNQPDEVVLLAIPYLNIIAISLIPLVIFQGFKQFSDGLSLTKHAMYATIIANLVNIGFNYVLIFGKFGFPKMGLVGAGIGTLISRVTMILIIWILLKNDEKTSPFITKIKLFALESKMLKKLTNIGLPSAMQMFFEVAIFTSAVWLSGVLGKNAQAANQIALNLSSMTFMIAMGLSVTATIRVGNQKGLKSYEELQRIAKSIFLMGIIFASVFAFLFLLLNDVLPAFYLDLKDVNNYLDNQEVVAIASKLLIVAALFQISDSAQIVFLGALRGLQDVKIPTMLTFTAYWIIGFPISYFLGKETVYGSLGIWIGLLVGLVSASIFLYLRFIYLTNRLIQAH
jgi:MATE family multidrug resistance protein